MAGDARDERSYSATEHMALLNDAVARETASLHSEKETLEGSVESLAAEKAALETEKSELQSRVDVLEAEKIAAEKARDEAVSEHAEYVRQLEELAALDTRRAERAAKVKEAASSLDDSYFTDARIDRWAGMAEEAFEALCADLAEFAAKTPAGDTGDGAVDEDKEKAAARETAAFKGGASPKSTDGTSTFRGLMAATGRVPSSSN